jgi:hypothetical protein
VSTDGRRSALGLVLPLAYMGQFLVFLAALGFIMARHRDMLVENHRIMLAAVARIEAQSAEMATRVRHIEYIVHQDQVYDRQRDRSWAKEIGLPVPPWTLDEPEPPEWLTAPLTPDDDPGTAAPPESEPAP